MQRLRSGENNHLPNCHLKNEAIGSTRQFHSPCWKKFRQKGFDSFIRFCWNDSACTLFRPTLSSYFFEVCPATLFAELSIFVPFTSSPIFSTANSIKTTPTRFAAGTINFRKNVLVVILITCASAPEHLSLCRLITLLIGIYAYLKQQLLMSFRLKRNVGGFFPHQIKSSDTDRYKVCVFTARALKNNMITINSFFQ